VKLPPPVFAVASSTIAGLRSRPAIGRLPGRSTEQSYAPLIAAAALAGLFPDPPNTTIRHRAAAKREARVRS
jgi:hypothetical protein